MPESAQNVTKGEVAGVKSHHPTQAEKARRIEQVVQWLCEGWPRRLIITELGSKFGLSPKSCDPYLAEARKVLVGMFCENREEFVATQLAALEDLAHKATKGKQYTAASGARATMARLTGTNGPQIGAAGREARARQVAQQKAEAAGLDSDDD